MSNPHTDLIERREALRAGIERLQVAQLVLWDGIRDAVKRLIRELQVAQLMLCDGIRDAVKRLIRDTVLLSGRAGRRRC